MSWQESLTKGCRLRKQSDRLATTITAEAAAQVEDDVTNKEEEELDKQYTAIKIDYEIEVVGEE